jgi:hypothetical protein
VTTTTGDRCVDNLSLHDPRVVGHLREPRQVHDTERQHRTLTFSGSLVKALLGDDGRTDGVDPRPAPARRARRRPGGPQGSQAPRTEEPT